MLSKDKDVSFLINRVTLAQYCRVLCCTECVY